MREEIKVLVQLTFDCDPARDTLGDIENALQGASHYLSEVQQGTYLTDILMLPLAKSTRRLEV